MHITAQIDAHYNADTGHWSFSFCGIPSFAQLERAMIVAALNLLQGNKTAAAKALGVDRRTLYRKCRDYTIERTAGAQ